jgi:hypothetical protein
MLFCKPGRFFNTDTTAHATQGYFNKVVNSGPVSQPVKKYGTFFIGVFIFYEAVG